MAIKIYEYAGCSTCKNALKYLDARKKNYEKVPIVEQPPSSYRDRLITNPSSS